MAKGVKIWVGINVQSGSEEKRRTLKGLCETLDLPYGTVKRRSGGNDGDVQVYVRKKDSVVFRVKKEILV
jgi:hypothetical protein